MAAARTGVVQALHRIVAARDDVVSDRELLRRFAARRDETAFAALVRRRGLMVYHTCRRVLRHDQDAEDAFQATFLVLARKAGSRAWQDSVAGWLHLVARRLALKARRPGRPTADVAADAPSPAPDPLDELSGRELCAAVDEELSRLPSGYRSAVLLCCLQGLARDEAARQLGWSFGELKGRLERGRELLRRRLGRRGIALSAGLAALLVPAGGRAAPPAVGPASARAVALAEGLLRGALLGPFKAAAALALALCLAGAGAGLGLRQAAQAPATEDRQPEAVLPGGRGAKSEERAARADRHGDPLPPLALARLGTVRMRHSAFTACAAFTPDGKTAIVGDADGNVVLWDVETGREVRRIAGRGGVVHALAVSADGKTLATGGWGKLFFWDLENLAAGAPTRAIAVANDSVMQIAFAPDGKSVALRYQGKVIDLWDVDTGAQRHVLKGHAGNVTSIAFSPDGKLLASGSWGDTFVRLWDVTTGEPARAIKAHQRDVLSVAFSPDGKELVSSGNLDPLRFWDPATGKKLRDVEHTDHGMCLSYFPDGKAIAGLSNSRVGVWDAATGKLLHESEGVPRNMGHLAVSPDGKTLATSWGGPHTFDLWDAVTGKPRHRFAGHRESVCALAFSADGGTLFSGAGITGDRLLAWDLADGKAPRELDEYPGGANDVALSPDGKYLASCGSGAPGVRVWDLAAGKEARRFEGNGQIVVSVAWSADGKTLVTGSYYDKAIRVWDAAAGKERRAIALPQDWPCPVAVSPDGKRVATGGFNDGSVRLWDADSGKELRTLAGADRTVYAVAFAPDGAALAVGGMSGGIDLWDPDTGRPMRRFDGRGRWVSQLRFSADGRTLVSGDGDGAVRLWEVATGKERASFAGNQVGVRSVALSRDGTRVASGGADTTILLWDATGLGSGAAPRGKLSDEELGALWSDLAGDDAARAYRALWAMARAPDRAVPLFAEKLRPVAEPDEAERKRIAALVADLDRDEFEAREKAVRELEQVGEAAGPALRKALEGKPTLEVRRRVEGLLEKVEGNDPERLRTGRALEALERIGTAEARAVLRTLAAGAAGARLTRDAKASLRRQ